MKEVALFLALVCSPAWAQSDPPQAGVDRNRLEQYIRDLEAFGTRYAGADNHGAVIDHVKSVFRSMGYEPETQRFEIPKEGWLKNMNPENYQQQFEGKRFENVIVTIPGRDRTLPPFVLGAHLDSINFKDFHASPREPNARAPGADDSGSALSALFEVARLLKGRTLERDVRIVAFDGEEQGQAGSSAYAKALKQRGESILGIIQLDMVGYGEKLAVEAPQESEWLLRAMQRVQAARGIDLKAEYGVGPPRSRYEQGGRNTGSDHMPFIREGYHGLGVYEAWGYPDIARDGYNPNYHSSTDRTDTLNLRLIEKTALLTIATVEEVAGPAGRGAADRGRIAGLADILRGQVIGTAHFGAAYALKGVIQAVLEWDLEVAKQHARELLQPGFWGSVILFGAASQATQAVAQAVASRLPAAVVQSLPKAAVRAASLGQVGLYMAAGMAAVQYATTGQISLKDLAVSTASYMIAGAAVNIVVDAVMLAVLGATPAGWVYIVAKLALTLYFGEKLDAWLRSLWPRITRAWAAGWEGVKPKLDRLLEGSPSVAFPQDEVVEPTAKEGPFRP